MRFSKRDGKNDLFLLVDRRDSSNPLSTSNVSMAACRYLVAVYEWMILNEEVAERRGLLLNGWIQFVPGERLERLMNRGFESSVVANAKRAARLLNDSPMKFDDLADGRVEHYESRR